MTNQSIAYHEAGHAVVASWLGAEVVSVTLEPDADDGPLRDGDAAIRWHHRGMTPRQLIQKELMAVLAGPVAEMIHNDQDCDIEQCEQWKSEWSADWHLAWQFARSLVPSDQHVEPLLKFTIERLYRIASAESFWQTIAEVADLLEAYETIDGEQVRQCVDRWLGE
jgi:ATP-dependent Zn protease